MLLIHNVLCLKKKVIENRVIASKIRQMYSELCLLQCPAFFGTREGDKDALRATFRRHAKKS